MIKIFGKNPDGNLKSKIEQSANYREGEFKNLSTTRMLAEEATFMKMAAEFFKADKNRVPAKEIPSVKTDLNSFSPDETSITWFGHSSYLISIHGKKILVDPVFSKSASPVPFVIRAFPGTSVYSADDFNEIDVLLLTHDHYDHLDYRTLLKLKGKVKSVICSLGVASHLHYWGYDSSTITELDWWESTQIDSSMKITATPARHFSGRSLKRAQTLWSSFVLESRDKRLFLGGDSGYGEHFKEIGEAFKTFDIAILECGQYNVKWPLIHMMPEQTVQAHLDLNADVLFPVHWGKFALAYHPWTEPIERLSANANKLGVKYTTPMIGEPIAIGGDLPRAEWWKS